MILTECKIRCTTVPTPPGTGSAVRKWHQLERLYLMVRDEKGNAGMGEASPLPGHSPETVADCSRSLSQALPLLTGMQISDIANIETLCGQVPIHLPSARFALESALLDLLARSTGVPLWRLFADNRTGIRVNALLRTERFQETTRRLYEQGIRVFKLKLNGKENLKNHLTMLHWLRDTYGDSIDIRIDANGTLRPDTLIETLGRIAAFFPEYVEEPVPFAQLSAASLPVPIAFDESLQRDDAVSQMLAHPSCQAVILKPSLLGGIFRARRLAAAASAASRDVIVTHMFESLPGFLAILHMAASLPLRRPCGLLPPATVHTENAHQYFTLQCDTIRPGDKPGIGVATDCLPTEDGESRC